MASFYNILKTVRAEDYWPLIRSTIERLYSQFSSSLNYYVSMLLFEISM